MTAIYTVLVEGDDLDDPIADASRSILDGHIVLSRKLANENHYPAVDVLKSVSRIMKDIVSPEQTELREQDHRGPLGIRKGGGPDQHRGVRRREATRR